MKAVLIKEISQGFVSVAGHWRCLIIHFLMAKRLYVTLGSSGCPADGSITNRYFALAELVWKCQSGYAMQTEADATKTLTWPFALCCWEAVVPLNPSPWFAWARC